MRNKCEIITMPAFGTENEMCKRALKYYYKECYDMGDSKNTEYMIAGKYLINKEKERLRLTVMEAIDDILKSNGIIPIFFKGACLGKLLYGDSYIRPVGDIDIYVDKKSFEKAKELIIKIGGADANNKQEDKEHHHSIVFEKYGVTVELHKNLVNKRIKLDMVYLESHVMDVLVNGRKFTTFDYNGYVVYMLYHIYMHVIDDVNSKMIELFFDNSRFCLKEILDNYKKNTLEIALFLEKFISVISIETIKKMFEKSTVTYTLIRILDDLIEILPDRIKTEFITLYHELKLMENDTPNEEIILSLSDLEANDSENIYEIRAIIANNIKKNHTGECICLKEMGMAERPMDEWKGISNTNGSYIIYGEKPCSSFDYSVNITITTDGETLKVKYRVFDDILVAGNYDKFDPYNCDCVGLMCVSTNEVDYVYRYIFGLVHEKDGAILVECYDCINMNKDMELKKCAHVKGGFNYENNGYSIVLSIPLAYLRLNPIDDLYIDIVGCDCDDINVGRKTTMSLTTNPYTYYDPRVFIKIEI